MVFAIHCLALLLLSATDGARSPSADSIQSLLQDRQLQELVLAGDKRGAEGFLARILAKSLLGPGAPLALAEEILPQVAALVLSEQLLSKEDHRARKREVKRMVGEGVFRKLGISREIAPTLLRFTVGALSGAEAESALKEEQDALKRSLSSTLKPPIP